MNRIQKKFSELKKEREKALIFFLTAGDPSLRKTEELVLAFEKEGADLIELGVPFSDPLADGPVIQAASTRALKRGTDLEKILATVRRIRRKSQVPLLLMSYLNPIFHYGLESFAKKARSSGVDGLIVPDLPPEEGLDLSRIMRRHGLDLVYLLAPTSSKKRQKIVTRASRGFVYFVSLTGVTGSRSAGAASVKKLIGSARRMAKIPVCAGFGIRTPEDAKKMAAVSDGVIIGSSVVSALSKERNLNAGRFAARFVRPFTKALRKVI